MALRSTRFYDPSSTDPFKLSRSKIELFLQCPRCFYLDRRLGIGRPEGPPFNLNKAVDTLLKKEFDLRRAKEETHPLIAAYGVAARPVARDELDRWRHNFAGVQYLHPETNFLVFGAIDDLWVNPEEEYIVVDYKATSKEGRIEALTSKWHEAYKRQMEVYQWLLRKNGLRVSDTGYFVYCNGRTDREAFDGKLEFDITLIPYVGDDNWVETTLFGIHKCLSEQVPPPPAAACDYCAYAAARGRIEH